MKCQWISTKGGLLLRYVEFVGGDKSTHMVHTKKINVPIENPPFTCLQ